MVSSRPPKDMLFPEYEGPRIARYFGDHWSMHLPFAFDLIRELKPRSFVELGVWKGESYFTFCQSVAAHALGTKCFGIDTWHGDKHMGVFPAALGQEVAAYNSRYADFSTLKRSTFDEAVGDFDDGSIDLLHIDGAHGYEDVKKDFETWLPKLSERGIVLFHDTVIRTTGFGVWQLWAEIAIEGRSFEFEYGHGLGVWKKTPLGADDSPWLRNLLLSDKRQQEFTKSYYALAAQAEGLFHNFGPERGKTQSLEGKNQSLEAKIQSLELKIQAIERDGKTLAQENDLLRRESWSYHRQNLNLEQINEHLRQIIASAEKWQQRSWLTRAFHRWRSSPQSPKKAGFFRKLERSLRKRRNKVIAFLLGRPRSEAKALKNVQTNPVMAPAGAAKCDVPLRSADSYTEGLPSVAHQERRRYFRQLCEQAARHSYAYVDYTTHESLQSSVKLIAFYLPQFHPIPENDEWWGRGFTEWTNVTKANPQFVEHYQPHFPGELGFYDLRLIENQKRQIELAKNYGLSGFCYYYYWFNGRKLLEAPLQQVLENPGLDFPFCICWANENWTRRWDGSEHEILAEQLHTPDTDQAFIAEIEPILRDRRYIRIGGRPLIIVYRVDLLPEPASTVRRWKEYCKQVGIEEPLFVAAKTFGIVDPRTYGFDASVEFPPHQIHVPCINEDLDILNHEYSGSVYDYMDVVTASKEFKWPEYKHFRTVMTSWDNEPRRPGKGRTFAFSSPERYQEWLSTVIQQTVENNRRDERLVFINAWNEWAEGAHLEPDRKYGYAYLDATREAIAALSVKEN